jgi:ligand-binding sensor domain-containing protein/signal transduction histidine kinase
MRACLVACILIGLATLASAEEYSHRIYRTEDGLPQNRIQAITQTPEGYLWIGTSEGLARFDGARFSVFDRSNTPAFSDNSILSLEPAHDGSLWIGTEGGGLLHYANGTFRAFGQSDGMTNGFVRSVRLDRRGVLWAGTDRGFFRLSNGRFTRLDNTPEIPLASVVSMAEDASGKMWVASSSGLLVVDRGKLVTAPCGESGIPPARAVLFLREGLVKDGCGVPKISLPDLDINSMRVDSSGCLWVGTLGQGLLKLDHGAVTSYKAPSVLPENTVFVVFEDRQHNMWIGSLDGLVRMGRTAVTTVTARDGLADENVTTTYEDRSGKLWFATYSGQIYRLNGTVPERYNLSQPGRDVRVRTIFEDHEGNYWFGTGGAGVIRQSPRGSVRYSRNDGLRSNAIRQILEGPDGIIWIATGSGLSRWDGRAFTNYYLEEGLSYPSVRALALDSNGDILAGTDAGLNRIHDGRIIPDPAFAELRQERVWSILVDDGVVWLGSRGGGLVRVKAGRVTRFTARDGLTSNSIYQIVDDRNGSLWMSSPAGVFSVKRKDLTDVAEGTSRTLNSVAYGTSDGMETSQMSGGVQPAGCRRSSGDLWFPSVRGAVRIDPAHFPEQRLAPVFIERVTAGEIPFLPSSEIVIPPSHGKLQIDYTACNLMGPQRLSFSYKLEGFDEAWTSGSKPRSAYYSNLPPGHYVFRVVAADSGAPNATSQASVAIYLKPAFHQTAGFFALCAVALICMAGAGLWGYTHQTKTRFALLLNERTRLAREMHDTVIQGCIGVSALLEAAARCQRSNVAEAVHLLDHARSEVKATIEEARQAVWNLRHSFGDGSPVSNLFDLARKLGEQHGTEVDTVIEGASISLDPATGQVILLVGREALRNAVTHGSPARIVVRISFETAGVRMEVSDDGKGFDPGDATPESETHFGILGMRERVEQHGGEFLLRSRPAEGTSVVAWLPSPRRSLVHDDTDRRTVAARVPER